MSQEKQKDEVIFLAAAVEQTSEKFEVYVPSTATTSEATFFTMRNFIVISIAIAVVYILVLVISICTKDDNERDSQLSESLISDYDSSYYYSEEYTNSQYLKSDRQNSLVDYKPFRYGQSLGGGGDRS